jgi:hypothetical protein
MRKIFNLKRKTNFKLVLPSSFITVGPSNCDYTSLTEATLNSPEGSHFVVYADTYDGIIYLKKNYDFTFIGRSVLKQSSNDYLFYFLEPDDWDGETPVNHYFYFSGTTPFLDPYDWSKWFKNPLDDSAFGGTFSLYGLYLERYMRVEQSGTNAPVAYDYNFYTEFPYYCNFNLNKLYTTPLYSRVSTGLFRIQMVPNGIPTSFKAYIVNAMPVSTSDRNLLWKQGWDNMVLDLEVRDGSGTLVDGFKANIQVKAPLYIEFA